MDDEFTPGPPSPAPTGVGVLVTGPPPPDDDNRKIDKRVLRKNINLGLYHDLVTTPKYESKKQKKNKVKSKKDFLLKDTETLTVAN